jgi:CHAT domain-containing protein/tetratricopeptide (TPR) repeat protein
MTMICFGTLRRPLPIFPVLGGLCLVMGSPLLSLAQSSTPAANSPCPSGLVQEITGCTVTLAPRQTISLSPAVSAGRVRMLTAEQLDGVLEVRVGPASASADPPPSDPFANQAGAHSHISVIVLSGERITLSNPAKDKAAKAELTFGTERAADDNASLERDGERAFAHAELLRTQDTHDLAVAISAYDEAIAKWQSAGNEKEMARALIWKADFLVNNEGKPALAPSVIERATPVLPDLDPIEVAHYWQVIAFIHTVHGDYDVVKDAYRRSLALYEAAGDNAHQAKILDNIARVDVMEGHSDRALAEENRAAELAEAAGDHRRQVFVLEELGVIYSTEGDSEAAYRAYGEALQAVKRLPAEPRLEAAIWVDLSDLYMTLGDFARVQDSLDQATAIWKNTNYPVGLTDTLNNYGDLYLLKGSPQQARKYFERGLALATSIQYERGSIALMGGIGDSYLYEHDAVHAEPVLLSALARAKKGEQTDFEMQLHCQLGDLALLKHSVTQATQQYTTCSMEAVEAHDVYTQIRAEGSLARTAFEGGALEEGQAHCEKALGMIEATRGELRNQDLKTSFFASQHSYYDLDIQILQRMDHAHPEEGYAWQAFLIAERARARTLLDQVMEADTHPSASPALLALYEDVQRKLRTLEAAKNPNLRSSASAASMRNAVERLTVSEHQLHDEILASGATSDAATFSHPLTLKSLQDSLPERHAALIEYWAGGTASYAWSITRAGIHSFRLPPAPTLARQCLGYRRVVLSAVSANPALTAERRAALQTTQDADLRTLGLQLSNTLLPPGMLPPGTSTVFLISDGPIESLPFAALPTISGALRRDVDFLSEPSATIFSLLETHTTTTHPMRVAIFSADTASNDPASQARSSSLPGHSSPLAALPYATDEARMIRATMGADATHLFSSAQVSRSTLQDLPWDQFSIGHFAMHAVLNEQYADLSALAFGPQRGESTSNFLWYGDVCHLHARLDLVVLSACNTALGEQVPGEGLRGLTQAFFAAGSQRVLGTLWQVDDEATSQWMRHFYQALKSTHSPLRALHDTQHTMAADPQWSAPYYWAGFVLSGDWRSLP